MELKLSLRLSGCQCRQSTTAERERVRLHSRYKPFVHEAGFVALLGSIAFGAFATERLESVFASDRELL